MGIKYAINRNFFKIWSSKMAYVLGFIAADGSLEDAPYLRGKYLRITSSDLEILEKLKRTMDSGHRFITIKPKTILIRGKQYISKEKYMLRVGSHEIYNDLVKLGITPHKSKTIQFPKVSHGCLSHFVRGYLDGDGCINFYNKKRRLSVTFTSGSQLFLEQLSKIISSLLDLKTHIAFRNNGAFQLKYSTREAVPFLKFIYSDVTNKLYLERKYKIFSDFLRAYPKWQ